MKSTDKESCNILVELLRAHGVKHAVISPGSRNAPLIIAFTSYNDIKKTVVVDERSAAFIALGIASITNEAVALVCTSGTAVLNYSPAIAEAYYRRIPLIVISADRPMEWIDQDDSQTLRQYEALSHYVKNSYNIPSRCDNDTSRWYVNRTVNDAMLSALTNRRAPVHINIQLDEPLGRYIEINNLPSRIIHKISPNTCLSDGDINELANRISRSQKVLIVAGFSQPDECLNDALSKIATLSNVVVMCESISNLHSADFICSIDSTLSVMTDAEKAELTPEIVITLGGAIVSRFIKHYFRSHDITEHWHIGITNTTIDCFQSLTHRIDVEPEHFFPQLAEMLTPTSSKYSQQWHSIANRARVSHDMYVGKSGWSDLKAFSIVMRELPSTWNLQLSNGTSIRYAQLFSSANVKRSDCNRGVSGIDGSTSTAIGASIAYNGVTLLITGDMSAQYDVGALACSSISPRFKMIVLCNGGGGIFRFIKSTSHLDELDDYFTVAQNLPLRQLADGYGFAYYEANSETSLNDALTLFIGECQRPAILAIHTPPEESAKILQNYFTRQQ